MDLVLATRSTHKIEEIRKILEVVPDLRVLDLTEAGVPYDAVEEDLEPYDTFEENAASKASYFQGITGMPTVADDSGIEIDLLGGAPGVRSKRFAPDRGFEGLALDQANNAHLLASLGDAPLAERTGRYVCVAVLNRGDPRDVTVLRGEAPGLILNAPRGSGGFGYDPLFLDEQLGKTFAEIAPEEKNARSHRGKAFRALAGELVAARRVPDSQVS
jgi:XTP/dITP diphosphohydrolase